jgi:hypothetical protein
VGIFCFGLFQLLLGIECNREKREVIVHPWKSQPFSVEYILEEVSYGVYKKILEVESAES